MRAPERSRVPPVLAEGALGECETCHVHGCRRAAGGTGATCHVIHGSVWQTPGNPEGTAPLDPKQASVLQRPHVSLATPVRREACSRRNGSRNAAGAPRRVNHRGSRRLPGSASSPHTCRGGLPRRCPGRVRRRRALLLRSPRRESQGERTRAWRSGDRLRPSDLWIPWHDAHAKVVHLPASPRDGLARGGSSLESIVRVLG